MQPRRCCDRVLCIQTLPCAFMTERAVHGRRTTRGEAAAWLQSHAAQCSALQRSTLQHPQHSTSPYKQRLARQSLDTLDAVEASWQFCLALAALPHRDQDAEYQNTRLHPRLHQ